MIKNILVLYLAVHLAQAALQWNLVFTDNFEDGYTNWVSNYTGNTDNSGKIISDPTNSTNNCLSFTALGSAIWSPLFASQTTCYKVSFDYLGYNATGSPRADLGQYIGWSFDFPNNFYGQWLGAPSSSVCSILYQYAGFCEVLKNGNTWHQYSFVFNASQWTNSTMQQYLKSGIRLLTYESSAPVGSIMFDNLQVEVWQDLGTTSTLTSSSTLSSSSTTTSTTSGTVGTLTVTSDGSLAPETQTSSKSKSNLGVIIGAAAGGGVGLLLLILVAVLLVRRSKKSPKENSEAMTDYSQFPNTASTTSSTSYSDLPISSKSSFSGSMSFRSRNNTQVAKTRVSLAWEIPFEELLEEVQIGKGSSGVVYRAKWRQGFVAVKKLAKESLTQRELEDFKAEVEILMHLRPHTNVIGFQGMCVSPLCVIVEFCSGGSLYTYLRTHDNIPMLTKRKWLRGIAAGMIHLHSEKLIHRDLAARNILLTGDIQPKISDFGYSRAINNVDTGATTVSDTGPLKWMSPESLLQRTYGIKTDVWSFGVLMYEVIAQSDPYPDLNAVQASSQIVTRNLKLTLPSDSPDWAHVLAAKCTDWEPENRPDFNEIYRMLDQ